ncbi:GntR family transcriptional regulator, partial [Pseudomonas gingeri]|nr:GntR family transcriptional regulator [Pseudomonas gingeri]
MTDIAPLIKRSLVDQALDQLRQRITQGVWAIG